MIINGRHLAAVLTTKLQAEVESLKQHNITPKIAILTYKSFEENWRAYVKQKIKLAKLLGITYEHIVLESEEQSELLNITTRLNNDPHTHGVIIQRPFHPHFDKHTVTNAVIREKDIDGFRQDSPYFPPVFLAVKHILSTISSYEHVSFEEYMKTKKVVVIGRGESAGKPIIDSLKKLQIYPIGVYREGNSTNEKMTSSEIIKRADIIISSVGKKIIYPSDIKSGVVLIGVGLYRGEDGKLHGDYDESKIESIALYYTPTPGGVGPLNVAYLFSNLLTAAQLQNRKS